MAPPEKAAFTFIPLGAILQEFRVAGHNIVQGFPTQAQYQKHNSPYFGTIIGRTSNRIKDGVIDNLNGRSYHLTKDEGPHSLHGGKEGWNTKIFDGPKTVHRDGKEGLEFKYLSKDGEDGYPGTVEVRVWYTASEEMGDDGVERTVLGMEYEVEFVGDECEETVVSVTNHTYFNLGNLPTIAGTEAILSTDAYLPTDSTGIPTGTIEHYSAPEVTKTFFLDDTNPDVDSCFIMDTDPSSIPLDTRSRPLKRLAAFKHIVSGLRLEVLSTEPAFTFYTGKYVDVPAVEGAPVRGPRSGFCVEPCRYLNAVNVPEWRGMCVLKKGQVYGSKIVYKAWEEKK